VNLAKQKSSIVHGTARKLSNFRKNHAMGTTLWAFTIPDFVQFWHFCAPLLHQSTTMHQI